MKKILIIVFSWAAILFPQTDQELFDQATKLYLLGLYNDALEVIDKVNSQEINTNPLKGEILDKIQGKQYVEDALLFDNATLNYIQGNYTEALSILNSIESKKINTEPLRKEIELKLSDHHFYDQYEPVVEKMENNNLMAITADINPKELDSNTKYSGINQSNQFEFPNSGESENSETTILIKSIPKEYATISGESNSIPYSIGFLLLVVAGIFVVYKYRIQNNSYPNLVLVDTNDGNSFKLKKSVNRIGRNQNNDIVLADETISKFHCMILSDRRQGQFMVNDLNSKNGTYINNKRIREQTVYPGDEIRFCDRNFKLYLT